MKLKILIIFLMLFMAAGDVISQSIYKSYISPVGGILSSGNYSIKGGLGEPVVGLIIAQSNRIKQGFYASITGTTSGLLTQTVTSTIVPTLVVGGKSVLLPSTASSGLPIYYTSSDTSIVSIHGNVLNIVGSGTVTINVYQYGNGTFSAASPVLETVTVIPASSSVNYDEVVSTTSIPSSLSSSSTSGTVSLQVTNPSLVSNVTFYYQPITSGVWQSAIISPNGNTYSFALNSQQTGEIGAKCYFKITASNGQWLPSDTSYIYTQYDQTNPVTNFVYGDSIANYNIISLPYNLGADSLVSTVLSNLGTYNNTLWRMYRFNAATQENEEYQQSSFEAMSSGRGYWLIVKNKTTIDIPQGNAWQVTQSDPYSINLLQGWNLIGNPYFFNLAWSDVQTANPGLGELVTYISGFQSGSSIMNKFSGGYVYSNKAMQINIPTIKNSTVNAARIAPFNRTGHFNSPNDWIINLDVQEGGLYNRIAGVGMNTNASITYDKFDLPTLPGPFSSSAVSFAIADPQVPILSRSIVPPVQQFTWQTSFSAANGSAKILWDTTLTRQLPQNLWLFDAENGSVLNMKTSTRYTSSSPNAHALRIFYGDSSFVSNQLSKSQPSVFIYPNPAQDFVTVSMLLSEVGTVKLYIKDLSGKIILEQTQYSPTVSASFSIDINTFPSGVYLITIENGSTILTKKLTLVK